MPALKDLKAAKKFNLKILAFGAPKSGKTHLAGSYTKGPIQVINFDPNGYNTLFKSTNENIDVELFHKKDMKDAKVWMEFNKWMGNKLGPIAKTLAANNGLLLIDSITLMVEALMDHIQNTDGKLFVGDNKIPPELQHWSKAQIMFKQVLDFFTNLPCAVMFTAHTREEKDELTGAIMGFPTSVTKTFGPKQGGYFDEVYYMRVNRGHYYCHTAGYQVYQSGTRVPGLMETEEDLTLDNVYNLWMTEGQRRD